MRTTMSTTNTIVIAFFLIVVELAWAAAPVADVDDAPLLRDCAFIGAAVRAHGIEAVWAQTEPTTAKSPHVPVPSAFLNLSNSARSSEWEGEEQLVMISRCRPDAIGTAAHDSCVGGVNLLARAVEDGGLHGAAHVVRLLAYCEETGVFVVEHVPHSLAVCGSVSWLEVCALAQDLVRSLQALHRAGLAMCDWDYSQWRVAFLPNSKWRRDVWQAGHDKEMDAGRDTEDETGSCPTEEHDEDVGPNGGQDLDGVDAKVARLSLSTVAGQRSSSAPGNGARRRRVQLKLVDVDIHPCPPVQLTRMGAGVHVPAHLIGTPRQDVLLLPHVLAYMFRRFWSPANRKAHPRDAQLRAEARVATEQMFARLYAACQRVSGRDEEGDVRIGDGDRSQESAESAGGGAGLSPAPLFSTDDVIAALQEIAQTGLAFFVK